MRKHYTHTTYAKLNLSLAILGKRKNMHILDSIVCPYDKYADTVSFYPRKNKNGKAKINRIIITSGYCGLKRLKFAAGMRKHLDKLAEHYNLSGDVKIKKGIPLGAGLGGSAAVISACAHAMLDCLKDNGQPKEIENDFLVTLGSDVPCMMTTGFRRIQGIGETITPLCYDKPLDIQSVVAKGGSNTAKCYQEFDKIALANTQNDADELLFDADRIIPQTVDEALANNINDLRMPAQSLNPNIKECLDALSKKTNCPARLSGCGSTVFCVTNFKRGD